MIEFILAMLMTWAFFAVPAGLLALPVWLFSRTRAQWSRPDFLVFVVPWAVWMLLFTFGPRDASLASAIVEAIALGCFAPVALLLRAIGGTRWNAKRTRMVGLVLASAAGIALWAFVPFIGE